MHYFFFNYISIKTHKMLRLNIIFSSESCAVLIR